MTPGAARPTVPGWIANLLLALSACLFMLVAGLGYFLYLARRPVTLEQLSSAELQRLVEKATYIAPPIYQPFPPSGPMLFYHLRPNTRYEDTLGDTFVTNDLGFRTVPTTPKPNDVKRLVIVGDSWTFGPSVKYEQSFPSRLETLLNRERKLWQVYSLAFPGWNTENEIAAFRAFAARLQPDAVVFCPTSNDIDDSYDIWNGRTIARGFTSGNVFRHSYLYESRWISVFKQLSEETQRLQQEGIPALVYFLAGWRKLAPYYAKLSGFEAPYVVVPTAYVDEQYLLSAHIDPGRHATPEGYQLIASYLHNALRELQMVTGSQILPIQQPVSFPGQKYDQVDVDTEFQAGAKSIVRSNLIPYSNGLLGRQGLFSVANQRNRKTVQVAFRLIADPGLYPLTVEARIESQEAPTVSKVFARFASGPQTIEIAKPASLDRFPFIEVRILPSRVVAAKKNLLPVSLMPPEISLH